MIDFEEAVKQYGSDFHGKHGFPGSMGGMPLKKDAKGKTDDKPEDPIKRILKHQEEEASKSANAPKMAKTGDGGQIVLEVPGTGHPKTPVAGETETPTPEATPSSKLAEEPTPTPHVSADASTEASTHDEL